MGCALASRLSPAVEYRTWPNRHPAGKLGRAVVSKASLTYPMAFDTRTSWPSDAAMPSALLASMLERVQAEIGEVTRFRVPEDSENAAFVAEFVEHQMWLIVEIRDNSVRRHAIARRCSSQDSMAVAQMCSDIGDQLVDSSSSLNRDLDPVSA